MKHSGLFRCCFEDNILTGVCKSHRWTKAHDLLVEQRIRKDQLAEAVRGSEARLRSELLTACV